LIGGKQNEKIIKISIDMPEIPKRGLKRGQSLIEVSNRSLDILADKERQAID
jgi:hypothetical protein